MEHGSRVSQVALNVHCERVRATEHAPCGPFNLFERIHGLAEIVERGAGVVVEHPRVATGSRTSPTTNEPLASTALLPNHTVKKLTATFLDARRAAAVDS